MLKVQWSESCNTCFLLIGVSAVQSVDVNTAAAVAVNSLNRDSDCDFGCGHLRWVELPQSLRPHAEKEVEVERAAVGTFISSLDMAGVSLSVMRVTDDLLALLDAPTDAPAWPRALPKPNLNKPLQPLSAHSRMAAEHVEADGAALAAGGELSDAARRVRCVLRCCANACIAAEPELTKQDEKVPACLASVRRTPCADRVSDCAH